MKCDRYAPLEANNAQAWPKIIAPRAAFGKVCEVRTIQRNAFGVGARPFGTGMGFDEVIESEKVLLRLGCEYDLTLHS
jgi:hypothetical protein